MIQCFSAGCSERVGRWKHFFFFTTGRGETCTFLQEFVPQHLSNICLQRRDEMRRDGESFLSEMSLCFGVSVRFLQLSSQEQHSIVCKHSSSSSWTVNSSCILFTNQEVEHLLSDFLWKYKTFCFFRSRLLLERLITTFCVQPFWLADVCDACSYNVHFNTHKWNLYALMIMIKCPSMLFTAY